MSTQHTPGPWAIGAYGRVITPDGEVLRTCGVATPGADSDEYRANTRLIAAAPDLLEACRLFLGYNADEGDDGVAFMLAYERAVTAAMKAVAKAVEGAQS
jgi:hypothetical protein